MSLAAFLKVFKFAEQILPYTLAVAGVPPDKIGTIVSLAGHAEVALGPGTGPEKLSHVLGGIADGMKTAGASDATIQAVQDAASTGLAAGLDLAKKVHAVAEAHAGADVASAGAVTGQF